MSIHLENASIGFGLKMEMLSQIASTDMTVRTQIDKSEYLDKILEGKVGFKSKNELKNFQEQGMMYFSDPEGYVQIRFVGEFSKSDIKRFVNGINNEYQRLVNPTAFKNKQNQYKRKKNREQTLNNKKEMELLRLKKEREEKENLAKQQKLKEEQERKLREIKEEERKVRKMKEERLKIEKRLNEEKMKENQLGNSKESNIQAQIRIEENKIKNLERNSVSSRVLEENSKISDMQIKIKKMKNQLKEKELSAENFEKELLEKELAEKEKELELKEKYEKIDQVLENDELIVLEDNSNSLIISSNLTDDSIINQVLENSYLGFSSRKELDEFQNIGDIKISKNDEGTYDFIFVGDYEEEKAKKYVENITDEYALIIQENTYLKVLEKIKEKNMNLESEIIDKEDSIVLTINI